MKISGLPLKIGTLLAASIVLLWARTEQLDQVSLVPVPSLDLLPVTISGSASTDGEVRLLAVDDKNQVAFAQQASGKNPGSLVVKTWTAGVIKEGQSYPAAVLTQNQQNVAPTELRADGTMTGSGKGADKGTFVFKDGRVYPAELPPFSGLQKVEARMNNGMLYGRFAAANLKQPIGRAGFALIQGETILFTSEMAVLEGVRVVTPPNSGANPSPGNHVGFYLTGLNESGWAVGSTDQSDVGYIWDQNTFYPVTGLPVSINNLNQVISGRDGEEGVFWVPNHERMVRSLLPKILQSQFRLISPKFLSNPDASGFVRILFTAEQMSGNPGEPAWKKGFFVLVLHPGLQPNDNHVLQIPDPLLQRLNPQISGMNSSGMITAVSHPSSGPAQAVLLVPMTLVNLADPYRGSDVIYNPSHHNQDVGIEFWKEDQDSNLKSVAWIAAHDPENTDNGHPAPRMPRLQARLSGPNLGRVCWRLQVVFRDRFGQPHRDFNTGGAQNTPVPSDIVVVPAKADEKNPATWRTISDGSAWSIFEDPDWQTAVKAGFFGGDAMLSVVVTNLDGTQVLLPRTDWKFRIAGENPDPEICKAFLQSLNPTLWWTYAVAKHESKGAGGRPYYNQFLDDGASHDVKGRSLRRRGLEGRPAWRDDGMPLNNLGTGGYGLFQLASDVTDPEFIMPRGWIWNWQENARQAVKQLGTAVIGNEVHPGAVKYLAIQRSRAFSGTAPVPVPRLSVSRTPTPHLGEPASQPLVMLGGDAAFGFPSMVNFIPKITFFDPTLRPADKGELFEVAESIHQFDAGLGSHYVQWTPAGWKFNRGRGRDLRSYVDLVAVEIDAEDLHTVAP